MNRSRRLALYTGMTALIVVIGLITINHWPPAGLSHISYDGVRYYAGTESILAEGRYLDLDGRPQQHWPPGLSLLYALASSLSNRPTLDLVVPFNSCSYVVTVVLLAFLLYRNAVRWPIAMLTIAALAWNGVYLSMHPLLWSEPPTLAFFVGAIVCLSEVARKTKHSTAWFAGALFCTAMCILLRYAFLPLALMAAGVAVWQRKWLYAVAVMLTPIPTIVTLTALGATRGGRSIAVLPLQWSQFGDAFTHLAEQMFPGRLGAGTVIILFFLVTIAIPLVALRTSAHGPIAVTAIVALAWSCAYVSFLAFTQIFTSPPTVVDLRMVLPLYFTAIISAAAASEMLVHRRQWMGAVVIGCLALATLRAARFVVSVNTGQPQKADCVGREWYVEAIRKHAPPGAIATNAQGTVWLALRRPIPYAGDEGTFVWIDAQRACEGVVERSMVRPSAPDENGLIIHRTAAR